MGNGVLWPGGGALDEPFGGDDEEEGEQEPPAVPDGDAAFPEDGDGALGDGAEGGGGGGGVDEVAAGFAGKFAHEVFAGGDGDGFVDVGADVDAGLAGDGVAFFVAAGGGEEDFAFGGGGDVGFPGAAGAIPLERDVGFAGTGLGGGEGEGGMGGG